MSLEWEIINIDSLKKKLDVLKQAKIDGSNNIPGKGPSNSSETENRIKEEIKFHYLKEVSNSVIASEIIEDEIRKCKELTKADGHKQLLEETKSKWALKFETFKSDYNTAKSKLSDIGQKLETFRVQNNIFAGREPMERTQFKFLITLMVPLILASIEILLNVGILSPVLGGATAISISFMVSIINVGLSFLIGRLCLTNLFHPVSTSSSKSLYYTIFALFLLILVYVNFMMGVFRGSMDIAQQAAMEFMDKQNIYAEKSREALFASVFPFDDLDKITFDSVWLILVGFFFGLFSVLDGYYFDDPINGYGSLGRKSQRAEIEFERLRSEGPKILGDYTQNVFGELKQKRDDRIGASNKWGRIINELQADQQNYYIFCSNVESALKSLLTSYKTENEKFRTEPSPEHFENRIDTDYIQDFPTAHLNIKTELRDDTEKEEQLSINETIIEKEYKETFAEYTTFFNSQRVEMFKVVEV